MSTADVLVVVGAIAAISWVNWYFFFAGTAAARKTGTREDSAP